MAKNKSTKEGEFEKSFEHSYPTIFQKKLFWNAVSAIAIAVIGYLFVKLIILTSNVLGYLQPVLVPLAVAAIIAYLLEPIIGKLIIRGIKRKRAFLLVYVTFIFVIIALGILVIAPSINQIKKWNETEKWQQINKKVVEFTESSIKRVENLPGFKKISNIYKEYTSLNGEEEGLVVGNIGAILNKSADAFKKIWKFVGGGFVRLWGVFGYILGIFLVPIYLYYFLKEGQKISENWMNYVPLRASRFKDEVVATLQEINSYLIAFFRGQMIVSMLDGLLVGIALFAIGLPYAPLIGIFVAILGLIPYIGNLLCLIPAILIAILHFSDKDNMWSFLPYPWVYPLIVIAIFTDRKSVV